jgi:hypothetical protein
MGISACEQQCVTMNNMFKSYNYCVQESEALSPLERLVAAKCYLMKVLRLRCTSCEGHVDFAMEGSDVVLPCMCRSTKAQPVYLGVFFRGDTYKLVLTSFAKQRSIPDFVNKALAKIVQNHSAEL